MDKVIWLGPIRGYDFDSMWMSHASSHLLILFMHLSSTQLLSSKGFLKIYSPKKTMRKKKLTVNLKNTTVVPLF